MKLLWAIIPVVIIAAGGFLFLANRPSAPEPSQAPQNTQAENTQNLSENYIVYSDGVLEQNANNRRVLFFFANWCPTCIPADREFGSTTQIPDDVTVIRVNYNDTDTDSEEEQLAEDYEITYQHTFVQIDENGQEIAKWNGGAVDNLLSSLE